MCISAENGYDKKPHQTLTQQRHAQVHVNDMWQNAGLLDKWAVAASTPPGRNERFDISHPGNVVNHKSIVHGTTGVINHLTGGNDVLYPTKVSAAMRA